MVKKETVFWFVAAKERHIEIKIITSKSCWTGKHAAERSENVAFPFAPPYYK